MAEDVFHLLGTKREDDDYYKLLGCDELSTAEQINTEFKYKARKFHPDKNRDGRNNESDRLFERLKIARDILCDKEKRAKYDHWRQIGIAVPFDNWTSLDKAAHSSVHWAAKPRKKPMLEYRLDSEDQLDKENGTQSHKRPLSQQKSSTPTAEDAVKAAYNIHGSHRSYVRVVWGSQNSGGHISKFRKYEI